MSILKSDLPYPESDGITESVRDGKIISPAYAGLKGELTAVLFYSYNHTVLDFQNSDLASLFADVSACEMLHYELLGKALVRLGIDPVVTPVPPFTGIPYNTSQITYYTDPTRILLACISAETETVESYRKMIRLISQDGLSALIERLIIDEQLHISAFKDALNSLTRERVR